MSFTVYVLALVAGGLVIGGLWGAFAPRGSSAGLPTTIVLSLGFTVIGGIFIVEIFDTTPTVGLPVALALAPLYLFFNAIKRGSGSRDTGGWSGIDSWGGGDSDGGGGD